MTKIKYDTEKRIYVKIVFYKNDKYQTLAKTVYFRNQMTIPFFYRWKWFFLYREALIRVKYPRAYIKLEYGPYDYVLPKDIYKKKIKDLLAGNKRKLTQYKNKIAYVKQNWNEIFPPEEHPQWVKVIEKLDYYTKTVEELNEEYLALDSGKHHQSTYKNADYYKELFNTNYINLKEF